MEQEEKQELTSPDLPVLPRLHRLDLLLQLLEEKHSLSGRHSCSSSVNVGRKMEAEDQCKTLSSALEEVHHKGTLMERVAMLENRVLQVEEAAYAQPCLRKSRGCRNSRKRKSSTVSILHLYRKLFGWFRVGC